MSEIKLLPCPFCGGDARLESTGQYAVVGCKNDNCQGYACCYKYDSKKEAIEHWNTRKPMERIFERLQEKGINTRGNAIEMSFTGMTKIINELDYGMSMAYTDAIKIVKEEGGIE